METLENLIKDPTLEVKFHFPDQVLKAKFLKKLFDEEGFCIFNEEWSEEQESGLFVQSYVVMVDKPEHNLQFKGIEFDYD